MYLFRIEKRKDVLKGRTIRYLANNIIHCSEVHLGNILKGKITCSYSMAKNITGSIYPDGKVENYINNYFIKLEK